MNMAKAVHGNYPTGSIGSLVKAEHTQNPNSRVCSGAGNLSTDPDEADLQPGGGRVAFLFECPCSDHVDIVRNYITHRLTTFPLPLSRVLTSMHSICCVSGRSECFQSRLKANPDEADLKPGGYSSRC